MRALLILNGSTGNRGCEAILLSTYTLIREAFPNSDFVNSSMLDPRTASVPYLQLPCMRHAPHPNTLSLEGIRWQVAKRFQGHNYNFERFLPRSDVVLSLGGDNYSMDYGSADKYLSANEKVFESGRPLIIWGASIGPFSSDTALEVRAAENLKRCQKIVVRETLTRDYLAELGVVENVTLGSDPAFRLSSQKTVLAPHVERMLDKGAIGVNLSPLLGRYRDEGGDWLTEATSWIDALLHATDQPILLIPHVMQPGNDDRNFLSKICERLGASIERLALLDASNLSSRNLKFVISRLTGFAGARTHATIAALGSGVPTLSIGYSSKARGINRDIFGHERWVVHHQELDASNFVAKVLELYREGAAIRSYLSKFIPSYRMNKEFVVRALASKSK